jgi:hypothetical protein
MAWDAGSLADETLYNTRYGPGPGYAWVQDGYNYEGYEPFVASYGGAVTAGDRMEEFSRTLRHDYHDYVTPVKVSRIYVV